MSDVSMYELEDIVWDDFDRSDDHIVPHSSNARVNRSSSEEDSWKKPRREATPVLSNAGNVYASDSVCQEKEERDSEPMTKKRNMLGKEPCSHAPDGIITASCDGDTIKDMPNLISDDSKMSSNCFKSSNVTSSSEFCSADGLVHDTSATGDSNSYGYPLTHISQTDDLSFLNNECGDKESSDLLYYGWPDIGNFEDVDRMLRNCDSSFGLGITENDNGLGWFTSEDPLGGTEQALNMDFEFPCPEPGALNDISRDHDPGESNNHKPSYISESKCEHMPKDHKKQPKHQNQAVAKKAGQCLAPGRYFYDFRDLKDLKSKDIQLSSDDKSDQVFTSIGNERQKRNLEPNCFGYMHNTTYPHPNYSYGPNQTAAGPVLTGVKSENKGLMSPSPMESSYVSNQVFSRDTSGDPSFQGAAAEIDMQKKVHQSHEFQPLFTGNPRQVGMILEDSKIDLVSAREQSHLSANEPESQSDIQGVQKGTSAEKYSLHVPESSSISSELDEISLEATSFHQLRQVMEQLDLRTKLCIRDSLYRLARSAEQRNNDGSLSSSAADFKDTGQPLMTEANNKCTGLMDMETDTNPIDRSVAHLLFHRPSDSSLTPPPLPLRPKTTADGSIVGPTMITRNMVRQEEAAAGEMNGD